jgi:hypothetical protein
MKVLALFTVWILGSLLTAVIPAVLLSLLTPLTYEGVITSPVFCAITALLGTCFIGPYSTLEVEKKYFRN